MLVSLRKIGTEAGPVAAARAETQTPPTQMTREEIILALRNGNYEVTSSTVTITNQQVDLIYDTSNGKAHVGNLVREKGTSRIISSTLPDTTFGELVLMGELHSYCQENDLPIFERYGVSGEQAENMLSKARKVLSRLEATV